MANVKISDLAAAASAAGTQEFEVNDSGTSKKLTGSQIAAYVRGEVTLGDLGITATSSELNTLDGITASTAELNTLDGVTASTAELNILDGVTASTAEINKLDGFAGSTNNLNATQFLSGRNKIINGNFDIWQRGTSRTTTGYLADRWDNRIIGSTATINRQSFTLGQTDVPNEPTYFYRAAVTSVAGAGNAVVLVQRVEGVRTFAGQTVTLSFWAKADASKNIAVGFQQFFGSGGSPSSNVVGIAVTTCALTTSWQKFTVTASIPSISGKTLGTNGDDQLLTRFWFDAGSDYDSRTNSLGQQSGTFDIAQVQLEAGNVATPFEVRPIGQELALCQRYYEKSYNPEIAPGTVGYVGMVAGRWSNTASDTVGGQVYFQTSKRSAPTIQIYSPDSGSSGAIRSASTGSDISVTSIPNAGASGFAYANLASAGTDGGWYRFHYTASAEL